MQGKQLMLITCYEYSKRQHTCILICMYVCVELLANYNFLYFTVKIYAWRF